MSFANLAAIFEESMKIIDTSPTLAELAKKSVNKTEVYNEASECTGNRHIKKSEGNCVSVLAGTSFDTARKLVDKYQGSKKVAVLNFANAYYPGGGVIAGARAQEECLCRCSTLYKSLKAVSTTSNFYEYHQNKRTFHPEDVNRTGIIYTPDVAIFRTDAYEILETPTLVDVITCAAPDIRYYECTEERLRAIHKEKATAILDLAVEHDVDVIVLGAFGCGAFKNPPELVADVYKQVLNQQTKNTEELLELEETLDYVVQEELKYQNCFEEVVFAIRSTNEVESVNYKIFREILEGVE